MPVGAITGYIDVAQLVLYAFWIFFAGLIFYLRREDKREGYPLESDRAGGVVVQGFPSFPGIKTFLLRDGATATVPSTKADRRDARVVPINAWPGTPMEPVGRSRCVTASALLPTPIARTSRNTRSREFRASFRCG